MCKLTTNRLTNSLIRLFYAVVVLRTLTAEHLQLLVFKLKSKV